MTLQDTYYIRPHYQDKESECLSLIHRNKHREAAKMKRERNMAQRKKQIKTSEKELNKIEISNLSDSEFKTLVRRIPQQHKKIQLEMKDTLIEIKKNLERNNSRVDVANDQINDLEHKEAKHNLSE